jgi:hypothetical protein
MGLLSKVWSKGLGPLLALILIAQGDVSHAYVHYDGSDWKLTGQGIVCCPCKVLAAATVLPAMAIARLPSTSASIKGIMRR